VNILLDTNVVLDHFLSREPNTDSIDKIFDMIYKDEIEAAVTANSITDIYYIISKSKGDISAREALRYLFDTLSIISIERDDCISALNLPMTDFEDAMVAVCAGKDSFDFIVSNDKEFLKVDPNIARVIPSDDLLKLISP